MIISVSLLDIVNQTLFHQEKSYQKKKYKLYFKRDISFLRNGETGKSNYKFNDRSCILLYNK